MKRLTPACKLVLFSLWYKRDYFRKHNKLDADGSFYYDDKRLAEDLGVSEKTIMHCKRFLKENGYINFISGKFRGTATSYWILKKPEKNSSFVHIPYIAKAENLPFKPENFPQKGSQNVTPNNINNKDINNIITDSSKEELKKGFLSLIELKGKKFAKQFFLNRGYPEQLLDEIILEEHSENHNTN